MKVVKILNSEKSTESYQIKSAAAEGYIRVIDESGEDYLYPGDFFWPIDLPKAAEKALNRQLMNTPVRNFFHSFFAIGGLRLPCALFFVLC